MLYIMELHENELDNLNPDEYKVIKKWWEDNAGNVIPCKEAAPKAYQWYLIAIDAKYYTSKPFPGMLLAEIDCSPRID